MGIKRDITDEMARIASMDDDAVELASSALLIARLQYPTADAAYYLSMLDDMAKRLRKRIPEQCEHELPVDLINKVLFEEEGFRGNSNDYYDPRNSCLNEVLERKLGIPITLSIVYIEVGRRAGLRTYGIGLPGHFIVGLLTDAGRIFVDPFNEGRTLTEDACRRIVGTRTGASRAFNRSFLDPVWPKQILVRLMRNLKGIYLSRNDQTRAASLLNWIVMLAPDDVRELLERAAYHEAVADYQGAAADLERCLDLTHDGEEKDKIRLRIALLKQHKTLIH
ncbi:MAG: transglutaminase-like domain-containing protein [Pseudomonadota bacterium]